MMYGYGFGPFGFAGGIFMFVWWILIIAVILGVVRALTGHRHFHGRSFMMDEKTPLDHLKERYAKGEIDKKEFEEKKKDLE